MSVPFPPHPRQHLLLLVFLIIAILIGKRLVSKMILSPPTVFHSPADCCFSYTPRRIRCTFMKDYFETSSECSQPGVIFLTNKGQRVCAKPNDPSVQECIKILKH
uniref:C-C motif chemokine n=1 Tax=Sciurus vulgaris TaxID=55149 RepID=A0A8D2CQI9_SCIVU